MKVKIEKKPKVFRPFKVTLDIESEAELAFLIRLHGGSYPQKFGVSTIDFYTTLFDEAGRMGIDLDKYPKIRTETILKKGGTF